MRATRARSRDFRLPFRHEDIDRVLDPQGLIRRLGGRVAGARDEPVSSAIVDGIWLDVVEGRLATGERLPTSRQVAIELGVSPRTVEQAYRELEARGVLATRPGEGTFISLRPPPEAERERRRKFMALCRETFSQARELGYSIDELIDALAEFRSIQSTDDNQETRS